MSFTTFSTTSLPSSYSRGMRLANRYTCGPPDGICPPYAIPISTTNGNPEYADAGRCTTAEKSGSKNFAIPFSSGSAPRGARQLESGARNASYF